MSWTDDTPSAKRQQAYIAELMAKSLTLLMYQTEREHPAHELQTKLVVSLGEARDAAMALSHALTPPSDLPVPKNDG